MFSFIKKKLGWGQDATPASAPAPAPASAPAPAGPVPAEPTGHVAAPAPAVSATSPTLPQPTASQAAPGAGTAAPAASGAPTLASPPPFTGGRDAGAPTPIAAPSPAPAPAEAPRRSWLDKLKHGLRKTGSSIAQVFTGTQIDDALYEELEEALLMADAGPSATEFLLQDLKRRVKEAKSTDPAQVKAC